MQVKHTLIQRPDPEIRLRASERGDVEIAEGRMKNRYFLSVIQQHAALPGSNQQVSGGRGQD